MPSGLQGERTTFRCGSGGFCPEPMDNVYLCLAFILGLNDIHLELRPQSIVT